MLLVILEKTLENPLDCKKIQPVHLKGDQSWIFIGRTDVKAEAPILWPPDVKSWLIGKDPDAGKDGGQEEKGTTEDETVGWYHQLNGHEFEQTPGVVAAQGRLICCSPWGHKESDMTYWLNSNNKRWNSHRWKSSGHGAATPGSVRMHLLANVSWNQSDPTCSFSYLDMPSSHFRHHAIIATSSSSLGR